MLRPNIDFEGIHARQAGTLPDEFGPRGTQLQSTCGALLAYGRQRD